MAVVVVVHTFNPSTQKTEAVYHYEPWANLVHIESSMAARATWCKALPQKGKKEGRKT